MFSSSAYARWASTFLLFISTTLPIAEFANAHEIRPSIVELNYTSNTDNTIDPELSIEISLNLESIMAGIGPEHDDTDSSANSDFYQKLRAMEPQQLLVEFEKFRDSFLSSIAIEGIEGSVVSKQLISVDISAVGDIKLPRDSNITLSVPLLDDTSAVSWQWSEAFGEVIVRANSDVEALDYAALLSAGQKSDLIQFTKNTKQSASSIFINYIVVGFEHILPKGADHILFVVGLFLLAPGWRPLVAQITTFTIAHSITLALGVSGLLLVSPSIVEPLIALSIVFVCVENFMTDRLNKWRIATVFCFGLLHGLGFASVLGEVGLAPSNFIVALLGFNVGVELGQLIVVVICLLLVGFWFASKSWYRQRISRPASIVVGLIGLYWFLQRTVLA